MTTIYVDSRKRVAGSDSNFEVDLGESLHLQSDARLAVYFGTSNSKGGSVKQKRGHLAQ